MVSSNAIICAEGIIRDVETNNISIFNVLEEVSSAVFPIVFQRFCAYAAAEKSGEEGAKQPCHLEIRLNGQALLTLPFTLDFQGKSWAKTIISIGGLVVPGAGLLQTVFLHEGRELNSYGIAVKRIESMASEVQ